MAIIGITGSIASGKTALLGYLATLGHPIFSCDHYVRELYQDPKMAGNIAEKFPEIQPFNKISLAKIIYSDELKRKKLESILHPLVANALEEFLEQLSSSGLTRGPINARWILGSSPEDHGSGAVFLEIPLLFEAGFEKYCTHIITLCCPTEVRLQRAIERGLTEEMFESIDNAQLPEELKVQKSDFIINTNVDWEEEIAEFHSVMKRI